MEQSKVLIIGHGAREQIGPFVEFYVTIVDLGHQAEELGVHCFGCCYEPQHPHWAPMTLVSMAFLMLSSTTYVVYFNLSMMLYQP